MSELVIRIRLAGATPTGRGQRASRFLEAERVAGARIADVARALGLPRQLIASGGRSPNRRVLFARRLVVYTLRLYERLSYPEIARALGLKNHTSALHLFRTAQSEYGGATEFEVIEDAATVGQEAA